LQPACQVRDGVWPLVAAVDPGMPVPPHANLGADAGATFAAVGRALRFAEELASLAGALSKKFRVGAAAVVWGADWLPRCFDALLERSEAALHSTEERAAAAHMVTDQRAERPVPDGSEYILSLPPSADGARNICPRAQSCWRKDGVRRPHGSLLYNLGAKGRAGGHAGQRLRLYATFNVADGMRLAFAS
jgi:hypothetical protein